MFVCLLVYLREKQLTRQGTNLDSCQAEEDRKCGSQAFKGKQTGSVNEGGQQAATWRISSLITEVDGGFRERVAHPRVSQDDLEEWSGHFGAV